MRTIKDMAPRLAGALGPRAGIATAILTAFLGVLGVAAPSTAQNMAMQTRPTA